MKMIFKLLNGCILVTSSALCFGADVRVCDTRTTDQEASYASGFLSEVEKNDSSAGMSGPIIKAIFAGNDAGVMKLLDAGIDPNLEVNVGLPYKMPLLDIAISACRPLTAVALINRGAKVDGTEGATPLVNAAENGLDTVVVALLDHHANINKTDFDGYTALREAAVQGHYSTVLLLLQAGADPNNSGNPNESILGPFATDSNSARIADLLKQYGAITKNNS